MEPHVIQSKRQRHLKTRLYQPMLIKFGCFFSLKANWDELKQNDGWGVADDDDDVLSRGRQLFNFFDVSRKKRFHFRNPPGEKIRGSANEVKDGGGTWMRKQMIFSKMFRRRKVPTFVNFYWRSMRNVANVAIVVDVANVVIVVGVAAAVVAVVFVIASLYCSWSNLESRISATLGHVDKF